MRFLIRATLPSASANEALKSGAVPELLGNFVKTYKPESAWFTMRDGERTCYFVVDVNDATDMPSINEPFWHVAGAKMEWTPVMSFDELQAGLKKHLGR
ncbi:MAG TPA: DUF3303 family protein [Kofleriaceae bacterium]|nr:DUF3303 family protein [Kofleriaceae bacterium]